MLGKTIMMNGENQHYNIKSTLKCDSLVSYLNETHECNFNFIQAVANAFAMNFLICINLHAGIL